jgi:hypothetical protein
MEEEQPEVDPQQAEEQRQQQEDRWGGGSAGGRESMFEYAPVLLYNKR